MSLSATTATPFIIGAGAGASPAGEGDHTPGTRGGPSPANPDTSVDTVDIVKEMDKYKLTDEDKKQADELQRRASPADVKPEDFKALAEAVSGKIKPNAEKMQAALRGDATALESLLVDFGKDMAQNLMYANIATQRNIQEATSGAQGDLAERKMAAKQTRNDAIKEALTQESRIKGQTARRTLESIVDRLQTEYPKAPADKLAAFALVEMREMLGAPESSKPAADDEIDWSSTL